MKSDNALPSVTKICANCQMGLLTDGCFETSFNRQGHGKPLTSTQAYTRVCRFYNVVDARCCLNTQATGELEPPPVPSLPTTESWLPFVENFKKDNL